MADDDTKGTGTGPDDDDLDDQDANGGTGTGGDDDADNDDAEEWTPPSKEEWEKVRNTVRARKDDVNKLRRELGELRAKVGQGSTDDEQKAQEAEQVRELKTKRIAGIAALAGEGLTKPQAKLAVRLLNLDDVELDDDGDGDFDDAIEELKESFPQLFTKPDTGNGGGNGRVRTPRVATGDRGDGGGASKRDPEMVKLLKQAGVPVR